MLRSPRRPGGHSGGGATSGAGPTKRGAKFQKHLMDGVITSLIEIASHDPVVDSEMAVYLHNQHTTFKQIVRRAQERGEVDSGWDPALLEEYVIGPVMYRVLLDDEPLDDETLDAFRRLAMTALLGTPPPA